MDQRHEWEAELGKRAAWAARTADEHGADDGGGGRPISPKWDSRPDSGKWLADGGETSAAPRVD